MGKTMNVASYYKHARSLGAFRAIDCIAIARLAAEDDRKSAARKHGGPAEVWTESQDGAQTLKFSRGIRVF